MQLKLKPFRNYQRNNAYVTYSNGVPLFSALSCGPPPTETQSLLRLEGSMYVRGTVGDILTYKCADGFTLDADDDGRIECLPTQRWSAVPDCLSKYG